MKNEEWNEYHKISCEYISHKDLGDQFGFDTIESFTTNITPKEGILFKTKNEALDAMIKQLEAMKDEW